MLIVKSFEMFCVICYNAGMEKEKNTSTTRSIRLSPELNERLAQIAKAEHRSVNNLVALIIEQYINEYQSKETSK